MAYFRKGEPAALAKVLRGMTECGAAPNDLWTRDQPDGDPFVMRAAELLEEQEAQIDLLTRLVDGIAGQTKISVDRTVSPKTQEPSERRKCDDCGHSGYEGGSTTESYCSSCGSTVPYPADDCCPECGDTNCMLIACPECGGRYWLEDECAEQPNTTMTAAPRAVD